MAFYRITVRYRGSKVLKGIRELPTANIDAAWRTFERLAIAGHQHDLLYFECVQLSRLSPDVKKYLEQDKRPAMPE